MLGHPFQESLNSPNSKQWRVGWGGTLCQCWFSRGFRGIWCKQRALPSAHPSSQLNVSETWCHF